MLHHGWIFVFLVSMVSTSIMLNPGAVLQRLVNTDGKLQKLGAFSVRVRQGSVSPPLEPPDEVIGNRILKELERIREYFPTGLYMVPQLDPFTVEELKPIQFNYIGLVRADIRLSNLVIRGLQQFEMKGLEVRLKNAPRLDFDVFFPVLQIDTLYRAKSNLLLSLTYDPKGTANVIATGLRARGIVKLDIVKREDLQNYFAVTGFRLALDIDDVQLAATGLMPSELIDSALTSVLSMLSTSIFEKIKSQVSAYVSQMVLQEVNEMLSNYSAGYIIDKVIFS